MDRVDLIELIAQYGDTERHLGSATDPDRKHHWHQRSEQLWDEITTRILRP